MFDGAVFKLLIFFFSTKHQFHQLQPVSQSTAAAALLNTRKTFSFFKNH